MENGGIIGKRTRGGYPIVDGGNLVQVAPYVLQNGTGDDRDGVLALPICTNAERLLKMFSALLVGAELIYPENPIEATIDFWQALEHVNKPEECECSEEFMQYPQWQWDSNPPNGVVRGRWIYTDGSVSEWSSNLRGLDGQDGKSPELRSIELSEGVYQLQWRYIGEGDNAWRVLQTLTDGEVPEFRYFDNYLQYKYVSETSASWRDIVQLQDGLTPELRATDTGLVQWRYVGETVWQTLYTRITAVDLDIVAPNQPSDANISGNVLQIDIARARNPEMRAVGQTIQWRQEGLSYQDLLEVECCEPSEVQEPTTITSAMACYAIERVIAYAERTIQDMLNAYDAGLDPLNRTDAAEEFAIEVGRRLLRGARRLPFIGTALALFESEVSDVEQIEASVTQSGRELVQAAGYCALLETNYSFNSIVWDAIKDRATSAGYGEHEGKNWFRDILDALSFDELRDRYNLYLQSGQESATCVTYNCNEPDWCLRFDFRLFQTYGFGGLAVIGGLGGLQGGEYFAPNTWRNGINAQRIFTLPQGSILTRAEMVFDVQLGESNGGAFAEPIQFGIRPNAQGGYTPLAQVPAGNYSDYTLIADGLLLIGTMELWLQVSSYNSLNQPVDGFAQVREIRLYGAGLAPEIGVSCP